MGFMGFVALASQRSLQTLKNALAPSRARRDELFDLDSGTDTDKMVSVGALDIPDDQLPHSNRYEAVAPSLFRRMMDDLPIISEDYVFVDIGAGKGRALLMASEFGFKRIIGVELSAALTSLAATNIRTYFHNKPKKPYIDLICMNGIKYQLPEENVVLFLNNPFDASIMTALVSNLENSLVKVPRSFYVVYLNPLHRQTFDISRSFSVKAHNSHYLIYQSVQPRASMSWLYVWFCEQEFQYFPWIFSF